MYLPSVLTRSFVAAVSLLAAGSVCAEEASKPAEPAWRSLFDGKTLEGWKVTNFGGEGEVTVEDACIVRLKVNES